MNLVVHPESQRLLDALLRDSPHAVLMSGPTGIGLATIAKFYAKKSLAQLITVLPEKNEVIDIEKGTITIDSIRRLYDITRTIEPAGRIIVIDYTERMAPAAQNAFLKLLEEPTNGTRFILLTHQPELILPTIASRTQKVAIRPITKEQSEALLNELGVTNSAKRTQLLFIGEGLPAELTRLVGDDIAFEARASLIKDARKLVIGSSYDRLLIAKKYKDSRPNALLLVEDALKLLRRTVAANGDTASLRVLTRFEIIHKRLSEQGNVRLQLSATVMV
ncbi:MAG: AAA family ATPase [Candidatus Saccharimonadaceae bacterium]